MSRARLRAELLELPTEPLYPIPWGAGPPPWRSALVTGANGFVGRHLCLRLERLGVPVLAVARDAERFWQGYSERAREQGGIELWRQELLALSPEALARAPDRAREPGVVFHLAASLFGDYSVNAELARRVADAWSAPTRSIVHLSSQAAAGPALASRSGGHEPRTDADPDAPVSQYGRSKLLAEQTLDRLVSERQGRVAHLRPCAVYGAGDTALLPLFGSVLRARVAVGIPGLSLDLIEVNDLVDALLRFAVCVERGEERMPLRALVNGGPPLPLSAIARAIDPRARVIELPRVLVRAARAVPGHYQDKLTEALAGPWWGSDARFRQLTGFVPRVECRRGLERTAQWYEQARWV